MRTHRFGRKIKLPSNIRSERGWLNTRSRRQKLKQGLKCFADKLTTILQ
jgi:hypothetical protein